MKKQARELLETPTPNKKKLWKVANGLSQFRDAEAKALAQKLTDKADKMGA